MRKILVIEDDPQIRRLLSKQLEANGCSPRTVESGEEGLCAAESDRPDVILLDINLPSINGFETLTRLRSGRRTAMIPVMMLTGQIE